jgi:glycosyltransferase involved in cell wall biosynthesis
VLAAPARLFACGCGKGERRWAARWWLPMRMKIGVLMGRYALSGVPLAQTRFARALAASGHQVDLLIGMVNPGNVAPALGDVRVLDFNKPRVASMLVSLVRYFKQQQPDVVFSAGDHLNAIVLIAALISGSRAKISCSSRVTPFDTYSNVLFSKRWILKYVMRVVMPRADALTCVSKDMVDQYRRVFRNAPHTSLYNIIDDRRSRLRMGENVDEPWLVEKSGPVLIAAGSLEPWKGFADLIHAMTGIPEASGARLLVLGDGSQKGELQELIEKLHLQHRVKLVGYVDNPLKFFKAADVFVLSSHVEGLPNVLVEAMMCGCTPVATDCPTGPREVLQDGRFGYLVPVGDQAAMAAAIVKAIEHPIRAAELEKAVKPFSESMVLEQHFALLGLSNNRAVGVADD